MSRNPEDLIGLRITALMGKQPDVSPEIKARLAYARQAALSRRGLATPSAPGRLSSVLTASLTGFRAASALALTLITGMALATYMIVVPPDLGTDSSGDLFYHVRAESPQSLEILE